MVLGHLAAGDLIAELRFEGPAFAVDFGDPLGGDGDVAVSVEELAVALDLPVAFLDRFAECRLVLFGVGFPLGDACEHFAGRVDALGCSLSTE